MIIFIYFKNVYFFPFPGKSPDCVPPCIWESSSPWLQAGYHILSNSHRLVLPWQWPYHTEHRESKDVSTGYRTVSYLTIKVIIYHLYSEAASIVWTILSLIPLFQTADNNIFFYITEVHINGYKIVANAILLAHCKLQDDKITIFVTCTSILD